jgi:hypothetical protein
LQHYYSGLRLPSGFVDWQKQKKHFIVMQQQVVAVVLLHVLMKVSVLLQLY